MLTKLPIDFIIYKDYYIVFMAFIVLNNDLLDIINSMDFDWIRVDYFKSAITIN